MKKIGFIIAAALISETLFAQEALKSTEEEYYDFLSLTGAVERPTLGYRTLSDSEWKFIEGGNGEIAQHPWQNNNLGTKRTLWQGEEGTNWFTRGFDHSLKLKIYGPEWYNSFNTKAPYGQNDGALWQGKGYNSSLTGGARLEAFGFEVTLKPQVCFSQNLSFDYIVSDSMQSELYLDKASKYGYFWNSVDAPQRFGDKAFFTFDWADTEIRWSWKTFTVGFGTQNIWLGPAWRNPVLHSNNAPSYPKVDLGFRKTKVYLPFCNWYIGDLEGRIWTGYLSESKYFDNDNSNDHNFFHGLTIAYSPSFLPGLTLSANRACLVKAKLKNLKYIIPKYANTTDENNEGEDQKLSICANWLFPKVGLEIFGELGVDDYTIPEYYFERTLVYTVGLKKTVTLSKKYDIRGEIIFEWNNSEMSQDFQFQWGYNFGFHHQNTQGYTNKGQWLGSGFGYGGNSQYLGFKVYYPRGDISIFGQHTNPDLNYIYSKAVNQVADWWNKGSKEFKPKSIWDIGVSSTFFINPNLYMTGTFIYDHIYFPFYDKKEINNCYNFHIGLSLKYSF